MSNIKRALLKCQQALPSIDKDGTNAEDGYTFTKADTLIEKVRSVTLSNGLVIRRSAVKVRAELTDLVAVSTFEISHPESGELEVHQFELPIVADKDRDKAALAAMTTSWGYWLRDLLALPRRDGIEVDTRKAAPPAPSAPPPAATPERFDGSDKDHRRRLQPHFRRLSVRSEKWQELLYRKLDGTPGDMLLERLEQEVHEAFARMDKEGGYRRGRRA